MEQIQKIQESEIQTIAEVQKAQTEQPGSKIEPSSSVFRTNLATRGKNEAGERTLNNFTLKGRLGEGAFSTVMKVLRAFDFEKGSESEEVEGGFEEARNIVKTSKKEAFELYAMKVMHIPTLER
jgi:hypothetical protein